MYDWAVSSLQAVVLTAVFPIFFVRVAAAELPVSRGTQALAIVVFGPLLFSVTIALTGSSRNAILSVITFFAVGAVVLAFVDVEKGQKAARDAEAGLRLAANV